MSGDDTSFSVIVLNARLPRMFWSDKKKYRKYEQKMKMKTKFTVTFKFEMSIHIGNQKQQIKVLSIMLRYETKSK